MFSALYQTKCYLLSSVHVPQPCTTNTTTYVTCLIGQSTLYAYALHGYNVSAKKNRYNLPRGSTALTYLPLFAD